MTPTQKMEFLKKNDSISVSLVVHSHKENDCIRVVHKISIQKYFETMTQKIRFLKKVTQNQII